MKLRFQSVALAFAAAAICPGQDSVPVYPIKNAPFSAVVVGSSISSKGSLEPKIYIARSSDGITYEANPAHSSEPKSKFDQIAIEDPLSNCTVQIKPLHSIYLWGVSDLAITLLAHTPGYAGCYSADCIREKDRRLQQEWAKTPVVISSQGETHRTPLGEKSADGMTLFGYRSETSTDSYVNESWDSDLGFMYSSAYRFRGSVSTMALSLLKLAEPDPELFLLQDSYFPPKNALSSAKTVFISKLAGQEDFQRRIESILTASRSLKIVQDPNAADVVVRLYVHDPEWISVWFIDPKNLSKDPEHIGMPYVLSVMLRSGNDLGNWADSPVVNTCFLNLWKRIETLRARPGTFGRSLKISR